MCRLILIKSLTHFPTLPHAAIQSRKRNQIHKTPRSQSKSKYFSLKTKHTTIGHNRAGASIWTHIKTRKKEILLKKFVTNLPQSPHLPLSVIKINVNCHSTNLQIHFHHVSSSTGAKQTNRKVFSSRATTFAFIWFGLVGIEKLCKYCWCFIDS